VVADAELADLRHRPNVRRPSCQARRISDLLLPGGAEPRSSSLCVPRPRTVVPISAPRLAQDLFPAQDPLYAATSKAPDHKPLLHLALPLKMPLPRKRYSVLNSKIPHDLESWVSPCGDVLRA
jgi:hypothetical protein